MHAFTRVAAFVIVLFSLSFLVSALPTPRTISTICGPTGSDQISTILAKLVVELQMKIAALGGCATKGELIIIIDAMVVLFKTCSADLLKVGAGVLITVEAKASIVASFCSILAVLAQVCVQISAKFGFFVVISCFTKLDFCLNLILKNLNFCIGDITQLIVKGLASVTVGAMAQVGFSSCLGSLGLGIKLLGY